MDASEGQTKKKFPEWHGIPGDGIKWNPGVDKSNCAGCGMRMTGCGRNVYGWGTEKKNPIVARPNNCLIGCVTCPNACLFNAIYFPGRENLGKIIKDNAVPGKVKIGLKDGLEKREKEDSCGRIR